MKEVNSKMTSRERVVRTLTHQEVDRPPRDIWSLPGVAMFRKNELDEMFARFPSDFAGPGVGYAPSSRASGVPNRIGSYVDEWGTRWEVKEDGIIGEVKEPILDEEYTGLETFDAPWEMLKGLDRDKVALACASTDKFVRAGTMTRPFERMQFLHGTENLFVDLALNEEKSYVLRDKLHAFSLAEMKFWASTPVDAVSFMDDWGTQRALLISPEKWREFYKPLYKEYCDILHDAGKFVFFHSDGHIEAIYPDLIEIGVDAVNSQLFCMDMEKLGREYAGKITFWGEIDRQRILPFGTEEEARAAVRRAYRALCPDGKLTSVIAQCEWGVKDPAANIAAVFDEWDAIARERG